MIIIIIIIINQTINPATSATLDHFSVNSAVVLCQFHQQEMLSDQAVTTTRNRSKQFSDFQQKKQHTNLAVSLYISYLGTKNKSSCQTLFLNST